MAWRIHDSVIRGEIDNRQKGVVRGKIWLDGMVEPLVLSLAGNACADLAGCLLEFTNPMPTVPMPKDNQLSPVQNGRIGDLTASRKVRVYDIPSEQAHAMTNRGEKPPEHMANCLYLEWFSDRSGRVVIESTDFNIQISPPEWRLTPQDEEQRLADTGEGWSRFLGKMTRAAEQLQRQAKDPEEEWDEFDYERFMKESDALTDKYSELLDKYGDSDEAQQKIAEEMGWTSEANEDDERHIEEMNAACEAAVNEPPQDPDPQREGIDWIRSEDGDLRHPLQHRCFTAAINLWHQCQELGIEEEADDDLAQFLFEFQFTSVKLGGALNGIAEGNRRIDPAFTVAWLKRALSHLHKCMAALEAVAAKEKPEPNPSPSLLPEPLIVEARRELLEIRQDILQLMQELRDQK